MATIKQRGGDKWQAQIRKLGVRMNKTFSDKSEAQAWASKTEKLIINGEIKPTMPFAQVLNEYKTIHMPDKAAGTQLMQNSQLAVWLEILGNPDIKQISAVDINRAKTALLKRNIEKATVNRYLQALSPVFTFAVEQGHISDTPFKHVRKFKEPAGRVRYLQQEEITRLLTECKNSTSVHLHSVVVIALLTGMRYNEIRGLKWRDVDLKNGVIVLENTKNGTQRSVPVVGRLIDIFRDIPSNNTAYVFASARTGRPVNLLLTFRKAVKRANIENFHFHDLRHTAASYLAMSGENLLIIAEILGHRTLSMVKRYAHLSDQHKASALEKLQQNCSTILPEANKNQA